MAWATSTRRDRLPKDWPNIRAKIIRRARGMCEATDHDPRCNGKGTEVDHITPGDNHSLNNLQLLNTHCHKAKTTAETVARNRGRAAMRRRPEETHPGKMQDSKDSRATRKASPSVSLDLSAPSGVSPAPGG